jgi:hypothetical protein
MAFLAADPKAEGDKVEEVEDPPIPSPPPENFVTLEMPFGQAQLGRKGASHGHASR